MTESTSAAICGSCGASNRATAKFCGGCGQPLLSEVVCSACGTTNPVGQRFCDECGQTLIGPEQPARSPASLLPKSFGDGRYEVVRFLGEGGRKRVYLARDTRLARDVAVAVFKSEGADERGILRARREAESMAKLGDHPNIVTVYDLGEEDNQLYLVSQYMSGGDIDGLVEQADDRRLAVEEVVRIGTEVARALEHAHSHGVVHRDIKPQNVWLSPDGTAKLGDFGLAMALGQARLTQEGSMVGTVNYMPPEQGLGREADARSDIYSLGALLYEVLCGVPPFVGNDAASVISQHISTAPMGPRWHRQDVPVALEALILKMLAKAPADRPQTAAEVRQTLEMIGALSGSVTIEPSDGAAAGRLTDGSFVGRERETEQLRTAVDEAVSRRGRIVMVSGDPGVGKTRLATEIDTYASLRGARVLWGSCYDGEGAPPYWPWIQVIRAYVHEQDDTDTLMSEVGSAAADIAQVVSDLRERLPNLPEPQALDPVQARFRLFDSITNFLINASSRRPLAIFLANLHVADKPSLELLQFLSREVTRARIFILGTYRDDPLSQNDALTQVLASIGRERGFSRLRLTGLSRDEAKAMVEGLLRQSLSTQRDLTLLDAIYDASEGNPYFIDEIVRFLIDTHALHQGHDGRWITDASDVSELGLPEGIRDTVTQRVSRLSENCREVLAAASVLGREFRVPLVAPVAELDEATVQEALREAIDAAILVTTATDREMLAFSHTAIRDTLYGGLAQRRRLDMHRTAGEALEEFYGDRIDSHLGEVAHHFARAAEQGADVDKAADYAWWAGERAAALYSFDEAVVQYQRALRLFERMPEEPTRRCELLLALGESQWRAGDVEGARSTFSTAGNEADGASLPQQYARAALGYGLGPGGFRVTEVADQRLIVLLRAALERLPMRDSALRVQAMARLAVELSYDEDRVEADRLSQEAVEMAQRVGETGVLVRAMYSRQWSIMGPDGIDDDLKAGEEIVRLARVIGDGDMEFQGHHLRLIAMLQLGNMHGVDEAINACERLAHELRQPSYEHQAATFRVMRATMQGRFKEAERLAQTALSVGQRADEETAIVTFGAQSFLIQWAIRANLDQLVDAGRSFADQQGQAWPAALIWLLTELEHMDEAGHRFEALAREGFERTHKNANWLTAICALSLAALALEKAESAELLYELLSPYAAQCAPVVAGAGCLGSNHTFLGVAAEASGRLDEAIEHFGQALVINERIGAQFITPRICYEYARTLRRRGGPGDQEKADQLIETGIEKGRKLGMPGEVERLLGLRMDADTIKDIDVRTSMFYVANSVTNARPDMQTAAAPDGTVTILFSDIENSTVLTESLGDQRWLDLLRQHNAIVREHLQRHGGFEVKSQGDGFMLAFPSARHAVLCAIDIQRGLSAHNAQGTGQSIKVRIGLHTGEAIKDRDDFFGKNVVLAARIGGYAQGGEILVSSLLKELIESSGDISFDRGREIELKGLSGSYRVFSVCWEPLSTGIALEADA